MTFIRSEISGEAVFDSEIVINQAPPFQNFMQFLVWEAHGLRFSLECIVVFISYNLIFLSITTTYKAPVPLFFHLAILFSLILLAVYVDSQILCRGNSILKSAFLSSYRGNFKEAVQLAEKSKYCLVPPIKSHFHLVLSELNTFAGNIKIAEENFSHAVRFGASPIDCIISRMRAYFFSGKTETAIQNCAPYLEKSPLLELEHAIITLVSFNDSKATREACHSVLGKESMTHPSGTSTHDLSQLLLTCTELNSGKAENALPEISIMLSLINPQLALFPALRPYISLVYLYRAKHYAKKKKTFSNARFDITRALGLCSYPVHKLIANELTEIIEK
ncbi:MAG TPA: hypothetical protein PKA63_02180 [Oligoflexia bacterium]|nr:hypothetical protein [Oligoflexia bacterium]HMP47459.1 hypothetical protein [Oligoflexia bacterium]